MDMTRAPKKQKMQLALEEEELRSLRIPSSAHRGNLSPSKNSFLPTLQEQAQERSLGPASRRPAGGLLAASGSGFPGSGEDALLAGRRDAPDQQVLSHISAELLESVKQVFLASGGALDLDQFARAMLKSLEPMQYATGKEARGQPMRQWVAAAAGGRTAARFPAEAEQELPAALGAAGYPGGATGVREPTRGAARAAAVIDLFQRVDVHGEGSITWDEVSNYLIEQGMAGGEEFTVDSIKTYEPSPVVDQSKHDSNIEKLVYMEQMDAIVCLSHNTRVWRLYDPKRCTLRQEVSGHRGTVVHCCYVDAFSQVATASADMTICMWDSVHLGLRNRMSAKDVQLCLQWDASSRSLFSGSIDGTLSRWDLQNMCLADTRRGQHKKAINDLLVVQDINLLASASSDGSILMWDTATMRPKKTFKGHKKGTFSLAYSMDYRCLLTAGLDQEALVWNPYVERVPIFRLKGHTHALIGVAVVPGTPQILSADVAGMFRLWDMRNFRCVQAFGGNETQGCDLSSFCTMPSHRRIAAGGAKLVMYDYMDEWGGESVTDTGGVTDALYNPHLGEFYTVSKQTVKAWNAGTGTLFKVMRDAARSEITAACLADNGRKIYLGDASGRVGAHGLNNGTLLTDFEAHGTDISCLSVWRGTNKVFSSSWDGVVKVHTDEGPRRPQLKAQFQNHRDGVTCMACSPELMLFATGGTDMQVCFYDLKTLKLDHALARLPHVISGLDFLGSRCLLAVADQGGFVSLWRVRPHPEKWTRVHYFRNLPLVATLSGTLELPAPGEEKGPPIPLSALCFAPLQTSGRAPQPLLYTADAKGGLRCWDLAALCERRGVADADLRELFDQQHLSQLHVAARGTTAGAEVARPAAIADRPERAFRTPSPATGPAAGAPAAPAGGGAFLTSVDVEGDRGRESRGSGVLPGTTVRAAVQASGLLEAPSVVERGIARSIAAQDRPDVRLLCHAEGHEDAVMSLHLTSQPVALLTCGHDRRVRTWSPRLERFGVLLQSKDQSFRFPYDLQAVQRAQLEAAGELLARIGPWTPVPRLPPLAPHGTRNSSEPLACLAIGGKRRPKVKKDPDSLWKITAEQVIGNPDADEEDYEALFEQMQRLGHGAQEDIPPDSAQERLTRHANFRHAGYMPQRTAALSKDEASAADRLAKAMAALGSDEFGTYSAMAKAIRPKVRNEVVVGD